MTKEPKPERKPNKLQAKPRAGVETEMVRKGAADAGPNQGRPRKIRDTLS